tara:strand:+ start:33682 stop:33900 length:219 start_codon:yes stop_codon:yes gene_type:complete
MHCCRFEKNNRYYELRLQRNLFNEWQLTRIYGGIGRKNAHMLHEIYMDLKEAQKRINVLSIYRVEKRGYDMI